MWLKQLFRPRIQTEALADILFTSWVLQDETTYMEKIGKHCSECKTMSGIQRETMQKQLFVYLVASVALALTYEYERQPIVTNTILAFKQFANNEMERRWNHSEEEIGDMVENAASSLHTLLNTDPKIERGLSFEWAQEWLKQIGITETNPMSLFLISSSWKTRQIHLAKMLKKCRVVSKQK